MNGITLLTAIVIHSNDDVECNGGGPDPETGKFVGWITHGLAKRYRPLVSTKPIYDSKEAATEAIESLVKQIRSKTIEELTNGPPN